MKILQENVFFRFCQQKKPQDILLMKAPADEDASGTTNNLPRSMLRAESVVDYSFTVKEHTDSPLKRGKEENAGRWKKIPRLFSSLVSRRSTSEAKSEL